MQTRDIAIVGYGTAGQAAALALSADGHRVQVFERAPAPGPVGAGLLLQPTGLAALWELGLLDAALAHGRRIGRLYGDRADGRGVMDMRYSGLDARLFGLGMQRGALFAILHAALDGAATLHAGCEVASVDVEAGRLRDRDGREHGPFDLLIAADGAASALRAALPKARLDAPYPWGARWCLLHEGQWPWPDELRQRYRHAERMLGVLPVGTRPGASAPQVSLFYSQPADQFTWPEVASFGDWRNEVLGLWPALEALLAPLQGPDQLLRARYRDVILGPVWHRGRLVGVGDAVHAMSPQLGQGVNMALLDALALRDALRDPSPLNTQLARYAGERRRHVAVYQFWSRWLTPLFQSATRWPAQLRDLSFLPAGKRWPGKGLMLRVLSGTQQGWLGQRRLAAGFLRALEEREGCAR